MSWLSRCGTFPIEGFIRIDPDHFKRVMPEWQGYCNEDSENAGTMSQFFTLLRLGTLLWDLVITFHPTTRIQNSNSTKFVFSGLEVPAREGPGKLRKCSEFLVPTWQAAALGGVTRRALCCKRSLARKRWRPRCISGLMAHCGTTLGIRR